MDKNKLENDKTIKTEEKIKANIAENETDSKDVGSTLSAEPKTAVANSTSNMYTTDITPKAVKKNNVWVWVGLGCFALLVLVGLGALVTIVLSNLSLNSPKVINTSTSTVKINTSTATTTKATSTDNTPQVVSKNGLLVWIDYQSGAGQKLKAWKDGVISELDSAGNYIQLIQVPDENTVYYEVNNPTLVATSDITIKKYDFITKSSSVVYEGESLLLLTFYDSNNILYVKEKEPFYSASSSIDIMIVNLTTKASTTLATINHGLPGRGAGFKDSLGIKLSPDKSKFLYINTADTSKDNSQNTFIFSLNKSEVTFSAVKLQEIEKAVYPIWKDNKSVIYLGSDNDFSYEFNVVTGSKAQLTNVLDNAYNFTFNPDKQQLMYATGGFNTVDTKTYVFDYNSMTNKLVTDGLGFWVNKDLVLVQALKLCDAAAGECGMTDYIYGPGKIYDIVNAQDIYLVEKSGSSFESKYK